MRKKWIGLLLLAVHIIFISGCQQSPSQTERSELDVPMNISIALWNVADDLIGDPVQIYIEEKFNIQFIPVSFNYDNYTSVLQQLSIHNDLPDIFASDIIGTSTYENWIETNKIRSIPKDLTAYPRLEEYLMQPYIERFRKSDDSFYAIPRMTYESEIMWALDRCILVRKDWMEHLGLSVPQSLEEFEAMLTAFVYDDPNGSGLDDTEGLTSVHPNTLEALYLSIFPELSNTERGWMFEDGQWMPVYNSKKTADALQIVQDFYRKGLISEQVFYTSSITAKDDFINGKIGAICMQYFALVQYFAEKDMLDKADEMILVLPPWPTEEGERYYFTTSLHWSELYFGSNVNDEKMNKILELLEWFLSDEFALIWQYGLEDIDWEIQEGNIVLLGNDQTSPIVKYPSLNLFRQLVEWNQDIQYQDTIANRLLYGEENIQTAKQQLEWFQNNTERVDYNFDIVFMSTPAKDNLVSNRVVQQKMFEVILGDEDAFTAWPKELNKLKETSTLPQAMKEVTDKAKELGIEP